MVNRQSEAPLTPLMAIDLDGTYVVCNSMRVYLQLGVAHLIKHLHLVRASKTLAQMALRAMRMISHRQMKWRCIELIGRDPELMAKVGEKLHKSINPAVESIIHDWQEQGGRVLLATAAPDIYIPEIWPGDFVATHVGIDDRVECRGKEKLRRVLNYADEQGLELKAIVTDHHDDMPLVNYDKSKLNIIVGNDITPC